MPLFGEATPSKQSDRSDRRHGATKHRSKQSKKLEGGKILGEVPDVEELRASRADYYVKSPDERRVHAQRPMAQEMKTRKSKESSGKREPLKRRSPTQRATAETGARSRHGEHKRERSDDSVYVYSSGQRGSRQRDVVVPVSLEEEDDDEEEEEEEELKKGDLSARPKANPRHPSEAPDEKSRTTHRKNGRRRESSVSRTSLRSDTARSSTLVGSRSRSRSSRSSSTLRPRSTTSRARSTTSSARHAEKSRPSKVAPRMMPILEELPLPDVPASRPRRSSIMFGGFFASVRLGKDNARYVPVSESES